MLPVATQGNEATVLSNRTVASLHDYISTNRDSSSLALRVLNDLHASKGIGKSLIKEVNTTRYIYTNDDNFYVFSYGGRLISLLAKPAIPMTKSRQTLLNKRFLPVDPINDKHLIKHFDHLVQLSAQKNNPLPNDIKHGKFILYMLDLQTPFVEIYENKNETLVIPLDFIKEAASIGMIPQSIILYAGQHIVLFTNEDYTVRILYASYLLTESLFTQK